MYLGLLLYLIGFDASLLVSRSLHDEMRGQTLSALVMLPTSIRFVVYSKLAGALLGLLPGLSCFLATLFGTNEGHKVLVDIFQSDPSGMQLASIVQAFTTLLLLPHLAAAYALLVRWGAVPLAIGSLFALSFVQSFVMQLVFFAINAASMDSYALFMCAMTVANILLCVGCHLFVLRRFRKLSER